MQPNTNKPARRKARINPVLQVGSPVLPSTLTKARKASGQDFRVRANPQMDESDQLESVRFTADYGAKVHVEWIIPACELAKALDTVESIGTRRLLLEHLRFGMRTELPEMYSAVQLLNLGLRKLQ